MNYILFALTIICSAVMDAVMSNNTFARFGLWFSQDGWKCKYLLAEWLNKFLPLWLSKFLAEDVLVIFSDLWHTMKSLMVLSFCLLVSPEQGPYLWLVWGFLFSPVYHFIRSV